MGNFKIDRDSPSFKHALELAKSDRDLRNKLVWARVSSGLTVDSVAAMLGMSVEYVNDLESVGYDPKQSELRRYAHVIGATVEYEVHQFRAVHNVVDLESKENPHEEVVQEAIDPEAQDR